MGCAIQSDRFISRTVIERRNQVEVAHDTPTPDLVSMGLIPAAFAVGFVHSAVCAASEPVTEEKAYEIGFEADGFNATPGHKHRT